MSFVQLKQKLDFNKANQQLRKDISVKLFQNSQSKQLRFNKHPDKENQSANSGQQQNAARKLLQALQMPLLRIFRDLMPIKMSIVCEKSIFDDVFSVGVSENSESHLDHFNNQISQIESMIKLSQCDAYKISFANLRCENKKRSKTNFSTIGSLKMSTVQESQVKFQYTMQNFNQLYFVIANIKRKKLYIALHEIRLFVMQQDLSCIQKRLQSIKQEALKKIVEKKHRGNRMVASVCLRYWLNQTINLRFLEYFFHWIRDKVRKNMKEALERIREQPEKRKCESEVEEEAALAVSRKKDPTMLMMRLEEYIQGQQQKVLKMLKLNALQRRRKLRSVSHGLECLQRALDSVQCSFALKKLQSKQLKRKSLLQTRLLASQIVNLRKKVLLQSFIKLQQF